MVRLNEAMKISKFFNVIFLTTKNSKINLQINFLEYWSRRTTFVNFDVSIFVARSLNFSQFLLNNKNSENTFEISTSQFFVSHCVH